MRPSTAPRAAMRMMAATGSTVSLATAATPTTARIKGRVTAVGEARARGHAHRSMAQEDTQDGQATESDEADGGADDTYAERADAGSMAGSEKRRPDPMAPVIATATAMPMADHGQGCSDRRGRLTVEQAARRRRAGPVPPLSSPRNRPGFGRRHRPCVADEDLVDIEADSRPTRCSPSEPTRMAADAAMT